MANSTNPTIWGIHAGKTCDATSLFLNQNCVALGWHSIGDLLPLRPVYVPEPIEDTED